MNGDKLIKYFKNADCFKNTFAHDLFNSQNGCVSVDLIGDQFKRQLISGNDYNDCKIQYNAFSGSTFINVNFVNCHLKGNGFIGSVFKNVNFKSKRKLAYTSNNWSQSYFYNCGLHNAIVRSCTISQSLFLECEITKTKFSAITFENTVFRKCILKNIDMHDINVDFMEFDNCELLNVKLAFFRVPFIFGGLNALSGSTILIDQNEKEIYLDEYVKILPELAGYYEKVNENFAACNIYIYLEEREKALSNLRAGILRALAKSDYRSIKYLCKLGIIGNLIQDEYAKEILDNLEEIIFGSGKNDGDSNFAINEELLHYGEIRGMLLNRTLNKNRVEVSIKTKIQSEQQDDVNLLLNTIDDVLTGMNLGQDKNYIEIRHNSPFEILVTYICQNLTTILGVTSSIISIVASFLSIKAIYKKHKDASKNEKKKLVLNELSKFNGNILENPKEIIDLSVDLACANLKETLRNAKKSDFNAIIDQFTSSIHNVTSTKLPNDIVLIKFDDDN